MVILDGNNKRYLINPANIFYVEMSRVVAGFYTLNIYSSNNTLLQLDYETEEDAYKQFKVLNNKLKSINR